MHTGLLLISGTSISGLVMRIGLAFVVYILVLVMEAKLNRKQQHNSKQVSSLVLTLAHA